MLALLPVEAPSVPNRFFHPTSTSLLPPPSLLVLAMKISLHLSSIGLRVVLFGVTIILCVGLVGFELQRFITSVIGGAGIYVDLPTLKFAADYFPNSAKLQARLAARMIESQTDNGQSHEALSEAAFQHAKKAVELAPSNFEYRVLLSAAAELKGDLSAAESALREAVRLASSNNNVRWQMANLCLRLGKIEESLKEFRFVAAAEPTRLPNILNLVWRATSGDLTALEQVAGNDAQSKLIFAEFLIERERFDAASQVFSQTDRAYRLQWPQTGRILDAFLKVGQWQLAERLWRDTMGYQNETTDSLLWNGSFEHATRKGFAQFDWQLNNSNYARLAIQSGGRSGNKALRLAYLGADTTRLDREAQHWAIVQPGLAYRLECFAKPEKLVTDEAPQIAVLRADNREVIAASFPVLPGANDWQMLTADFIAPANLSAVIVVIKQTPQYRYTEPTQGGIWFDDFSLKAQ